MNDQEGELRIEALIRVGAMLQHGTADLELPEQLAVRAAYRHAEARVRQPSSQHVLCELCVCVWCVHFGPARVRERPVHVGGLEVRGEEGRAPMPRGIAMRQAHHLGIAGGAARKVDHHRLVRSCHCNVGTRESCSRCHEVDRGEEMVSIDPSSTRCCVLVALVGKGIGLALSISHTKAPRTGQRIEADERQLVIVCQHDLVSNQV